MKSGETSSDCGSKRTKNFILNNAHSTENLGSCGRLIELLGDIYKKFKQNSSFDGTASELRRVLFDLIGVAACIPFCFWVVGERFQNVSVASARKLV